jgi:hypothetical protein
MYSEQVLRVREKLKQAAAADPNLQVFGARMHQYRSALSHRSQIAGNL